MGWAYGIDLIDSKTAEEAVVENWEGDFKTEQEALSAARAAHGPDANIVLGIVTPMSYASLLPTAKQILAGMRESVAEEGGDLTCFDDLTLDEQQRLDRELRAMVGIWEEELPEAKRCRAVRVRSKRLVAPLPAVE